MTKVMLPRSEQFGTTKGQKKSHDTYKVLIWLGKLYSNIVFVGYVIRKSLNIFASQVL